MELFRHIQCVIFCVEFDSSLDLDKEGENILKLVKVALRG